MFPEDVSRLVARLSYKNWEFRVRALGEEHSYLQVRFVDPLTDEEWGGRKWLLSPNMVENEVVQTALKAVLAAEEHEAREKFLMDGVALFGPHQSLASRLELAKTHEVRA